MPFGNNVIRPFTREAVEALNSRQLGVYGIFRQNQWIYVGCGDIRARLLTHLNGANPCIMINRPTSWVAEVTPSYLTRERELIAELNPLCNEHRG